MKIEIAEGRKKQMYSKEKEIKEICKKEKQTRWQERKKTRET